MAETVIMRLGAPSAAFLELRGFQTNFANWEVEPTSDGLIVPSEMEIVLRKDGMELLLIARPKLIEGEEAIDAEGR